MINDYKTQIVVRLSLWAQSPEEAQDKLDDLERELRAHFAHFFTKHAIAEYQMVFEDPRPAEEEQ